MPKSIFFICRRSAANAHFSTKSCMERFVTRNLDSALRGIGLANIRQCLLRPMLPPPLFDLEILWQSGFASVLRTVSTLEFTHFRINVHFSTFSYHRVSPARRERPVCRSVKTCIFQRNRVGNGPRPFRERRPACRSATPTIQLRI